MVCIYCSSKTNVFNSRQSRQSFSTWRRRRCSKCSSLFTTIEKPNYNQSLLFKQSDNQMMPFSEEKLLISLVDSLKHRINYLEDAVSLKDTILKQLLSELHTSIITHSDIVNKTYSVLNRFDQAASTYYKAYFMN